MATARLYADFQNLDDFNRIRLTCAGTQTDIVREGIELRDGLSVTLYTDDANDEGQPDELRVDGVVQFDPQGQCWVAAVNWAALRHASDEASGNEARASAAGPNGNGGARMANAQVEQPGS